MAEEFGADLFVEDPVGIVQLVDGVGSGRTKTAWRDKGQVAVVE